MRHIIVLILTITVVGCSQEQSHNAVLNKAEELVFQHPDSVIQMLDPLWSDTAMTKADRALYGLLYTEALHRSGLSTGEDSLILASRKYYEATGDDAHLARALLHHGIILYRQRHTNEAIMAMKRAEQMAERMTSPGFKWYLYSVLGDINDNVDNSAQTMRYYKQALAEARKSGNDTWTVQTLNNIAATFDAMNETDSLKFYTEQAAAKAAKTEGEVRATHLVNEASYLLHIGKQAEAKRLLIKARSISPTDRGEKLLADIYLAEGDSVAAIQRWYQLVNSFSPDVSTRSYQLLIDHFNLQGDTKNALIFSQQLNDVYQRICERNDAAGVIDLQKQFDEQQKERQQYKTVIALLSAIILLALIAALIVWYNRRRIDQLNTRFLESQQRYSLTRSQLTQMRRQKEREQRENSSQIKDVTARLHATANRGQAATDEDMNTLAQLSFSLCPPLHQLLSPLSAKEQRVSLLIRHNFLPTEIATLTISTPQAVTNMRVRLLRKLFDQSGGAKDFDNAIKTYV